MQEQHKDVIDIKKLFSVIKSCIVPIILFTSIIVVLAGYKIYTAPHIYSSYTTIDFGSKKRKKDAKAMLSEAFESVETNLDTEIQVITSRVTLKKLMKEIDFSTHYYKKKKLKKIEIYKKAPFSIKFIKKDKIGRVKFSLKFIEKDKFLLESLQDENRSKGLYSKVHSFGEYIDFETLSLVVNRENHKMDASQYYFSYTNDKEAILSSIRSKLTVRKLSKESSIIRISYEDRIPQRAKKVVEKLSDIYIKENLDSRKQEARNSLKFIKDQLSIINRELKESENELEIYKKYNNIIDIDISTKIALTKLTEYENEVSALELKLDMLHSIEKFLSTNDIAGISIESLDFSTSIISSLILSLQEKQLELNSLLIEFTQLHPQVIRLEGQIRNLKNTIKKKIYAIKRNLKNKKHTFEKRVSKYKKILLKLPQKEIQLVNLKRSFSINEKIYSYLLQKQAEMEIVKASTISTIRVLDNPIVAKKPIKPKKTLILVVAIVLGLGISIFIASIRDIVLNKLNSTKDVERITDIPILGTIPKRKKSEKQILAYDEAFISLGTTLYFILPHSKSNIITITSSKKDEDKNSIAIDLAKVLTTQTKKVILLDLDMRDAQIHNIVDGQHKGISDILLNNIDIDTLIHKIDYRYTEDIYRSFYSISAGEMIPKNPSELVMDGRLDSILLYLSKKFDYILINTTPLEDGKDAIVLMEKSDITLLTVKDRYTKKNHIKSFDKIVSEYDVKSAGIIFYLAK
jgi:uncharacterized protein involved in exopolysaccharide biosynthesis